MEMLQGKHFSITDPKGVNTVIYQINKTKKEFLKDYPKYTVERLDFTEEIRGENRRKTFYVDEPQPNGNQLVILSFGKENVVINSGILIDDEVRISKHQHHLSLIHYIQKKNRNLKNLTIHQI